jgi:hypothetical protein
MSGFIIVRVSAKTIHNEALITIFATADWRVGHTSLFVTAP